jgi:hypothetical protein
LAQKNLKELMPDASPPKLFRTPDNIEWAFLKECSAFDKLEEYRYENQCKYKAGVVTWSRVRFHCNRKFTHNCEFSLLAMKTIKEGYYVYKKGEHNHQPAANSKFGFYRNNFEYFY